MSTAADAHAKAHSASSDLSVELSSRRTGMSFQRTRMSADRTLMSIIRTSLSLNGFGFTIFQLFEKLRDAQVLKRAQEPRNFGIALTALGSAMLIAGIVFHVNFMLGLRRERAIMTAQGLIHAESVFPVSLTLLVAIALLILGLFAIATMVDPGGAFG